MKTLRLSASEPGVAMVFRERGIYCLPNGRELIVIRHDQEGSVLFSLVGEFVVNEAGRLVYEGKLTAWDISNLSDTGRTSVDSFVP